MTTVTLQGKIEWMDSLGNLHPVRNARLELYERDELLFGAGVVDIPISGPGFGAGGATDYSGEFTFTVPAYSALDLGNTISPEGEVYLYLWSEAFYYPYQYWAKKNDGNFYEYFSPIQTISTVPTTVPYDFSTVFDSATEIGKLFSIYDAIFVGQEYGVAVFQDTETENNRELPLLDIIYPDQDAASQGYEGGYYLNNKIHLSPGIWEDWDTILHEFGHYLAEVDQLDDLDNRGLFDIIGDIIFGEDIHMIGKSNIDTLGKYDGVRLAWSEGLANYLSIAIQSFANERTFEDGTKLLPQGLPSVDTSNLTYFEADGIDFENASFLGEGEGDELAVARVLWDLADGVNEPYDEIQVSFDSSVGNTVGHVALYKILDQVAKNSPLVETSLDRLDDIWDFFSFNSETLNYLGLSSDLSDNEKRAKLGSVFEGNGISPHLTNVPSGFVLDFEWNVGNLVVDPNKPKQNLGNDVFEVYIFDQDFELYFPKILDQKNRGQEWFLDPNTGTASWIPTLEERELLKSGTNYIVVAGSDIQSGIGQGQQYALAEQTGLYWSGAYSFNVEQLENIANDTDVDGIADAIEELAGDRNNDGVADSEQSNVASFVQSNNSGTNPDTFITLESPENTVLAGVSVTDTLPVNSPDDVEFPLGLLDFSVLNLVAGGTTQVALYLPKNITADTYWKYDNRLGWYEFLYDGTTGAEFVDSDGDGVSDRIILHFIDGGRGDADGVANGVIVDPGAPGLREGGPNQAPVLNSAIVDQTITANQSFSFTIPANTFSDPDPNDTLSYSLRIRRDLIQNGSFESGAVTEDFNFIPLNVGSTAIDQWTVTRNQIDYYDNEWVAADGDRSLDLNGTPGVGGIAQTIATEVGREYTVTFALAGHNSGLLQTLGISAAGQTETFEFQSSQDPNNLGWSQQSWQFTATEPETTLEFYSLQRAYAYGGPALDAVSIVVSDAPFPDWLTFDTITGTLRGTPATDDIGTMEIEAIATDSSGQSVSDDFELTVAPSNPTGYRPKIVDVSVLTSSPAPPAPPALPAPPASPASLFATPPIPIKFNPTPATRFTGTKTNDRLPGTSKRDILKGHNGNDFLFGKGGHDKLLGGQGRDRLNGGGGRDYLRGDNGRDTLLGNAGDDLLWGGNDQDKDKLKGGRGADTFLFKHLTGQADVIMDFQPGQDLMDLRAILGKGQHNVYSGVEAFRQFIHLKPLGRHTAVQIDVSGLSNGAVNGRTETVAILHRTGADTVQSTDFIL